MPASNLPPPKWWRSRLRSFGFAFQGVADLLATQVHAKFHALATLAVLLLALGFGVSRLESLALVLAIGLVWTAEAVNTAVELLVDLVHPEWHRRAGRIKDMAAGAVLLASLTALAVGLIIFIPTFWARLSE